MAGVESQDDLEVPPLEDCSEYFTSSRTNTADATKTDRQKDVVSVSKECPASHRSVSKPAKSAGGFGGMKKGFLFASKEKKTAAPLQTAEPEDNMPFIKPSTGEDKSSLQFPEVQEAIKSPLLNSTEWVTDELLGKIEANPKLASQFTNPKMMQALHRFQTNPKEAMKEFQNDTKVQEFVREFCSLMGAHFDALADSQEQQTPEPMLSETKDRDKDSNRVQNILADKDIRMALMDKDVQTLIELLRTEPGKAHRFLNQAGRELQRKVRLLVDAGVLAFQ